jgi:hypothetical protein
MVIVILLIVVISYFNKKIQRQIDKNGYRGSKRAVTVHYQPPTSVAEAILYHMRYFDNNPKIVAALIYHWAAK